MEIQQFLQAFRNYRPTNLDIAIVLAGLAVVIRLPGVPTPVGTGHARAHPAAAGENCLLERLPGTPNLSNEEISLLAGVPGAPNPEAALSKVTNNIQFDQFVRDKINRAERYNCRA